ncbi:blr0228; hypothetical protein [hydrothermal vent metagenome]|uniref:Methyltransferase domain-containing protein n=1 Tax=hydrothermal vent metagenome TaxID=652676 RepID=A0A3B0U190_9ZZZZ
MLGGRKEHWEQVFIEKDADAVSWFQESPEPSLGLIGQFDNKPAAPLIDIGAGASLLVDKLFERGFGDITLLDISEAALAKTRARLGRLSHEINYIVTDITKWSPAHKYHLWHDRAVFHFLVTRDDQDAYIKALEKASSEGSIVIMGTFALDGPEKCSGLPVQKYSGQTLQERLGPGFELLKTLDHTHLTPAQRQQKFTFSVFKRR